MSVEDYLFFKTCTHGISSLAYKCLVNSLKAVSDGRNPSAIYSQTLVVRFLPFERKLLTELVKDVLPEKLRRDAKLPGPIDLIWYRLFYRWSWASAVLRQILAELDPFQMEVEHEGDQKRAWETCLKSLRTRNTRIFSDRRFYRTQQLIRDNEAFALQVGRLDRAEIAVQPHDEDLDLWRMLGFLFVENIHATRHWSGWHSVSRGFSTSKFAMRSAGERLPVTDEDLDGQPVENLKELVLNELVGNHKTHVSYVLPHYTISRSWSVLCHNDSAGIASTSENKAAPEKSASEVAVNIIMDANDTWDVWNFVRLFRVHLADAFPLKELIASSAFSGHWEAKILRRLDENHDDLGYFPKKVEMQSKDRSQDSFLENDMYRELSTEYENRLKKGPLLNPIEFLKYIDWHELETATTDNFEEVFDKLGLPDSEFLNSDFKVWTKADKNVSSNVLYLTEDLYCHHIDDGYTYPGFLLDGNVLFRCRSLEETPFCSDLHRFWQDWNDVAISKDPSDGRFYLLETIAGIKARSLKETNTESGTMLFFDQKWRYRDALDSQREQLLEILGPRYDRSYGDFLVYIDSAQFELESAKAIGEGTFGRVYSLPWRKKPVEVSVDHIEEQLGNVAVKIAHTHLGKSLDSEAKFFAELATVYKAVKGGTTLAGFVKFFGFTKLPVDPDTHDICSTSGTNPEDARLALVFDYASGGTLTEYLQRDIQPGKPCFSWGEICSCLLDIARALEEIHSRSIVHRDIHPGNVLIQNEVDPAEGEDVSTYVLLADLGEAGAVDTVFPETAKNSRASRADLKKSVPPEIHVQGYTTGSDIFDLGQLAIDVIRQAHFALVWEDGQIRFPKRLMFILENCLANDPAERPTAAKLTTMIREATYELWGKQENEIDWILGDYELPKVARRLSTTLQMSSEWFRSDWATS